MDMSTDNHLLRWTDTGRGAGGRTCSLGWEDGGTDGGSERATLKLDLEAEARFSRQRDSKGMEMERKEKTERPPWGPSREAVGESRVRGVCRARS